MEVSRKKDNFCRCCSPRSFNHQKGAVLMKKLSLPITFFFALTMATSVMAGGGNEHEHGNGHHPPPFSSPGSSSSSDANVHVTANPSAAATSGSSSNANAQATGVNGNISPTQKTTVTTGPQTNQLNGHVDGTFNNKFNGSVQGTNTGMFKNDGHQSVDVNNTIRTGDVSGTLKGGNNTATQTQSQSADNNGVSATGNQTNFNYEAPKIPVSSPAAIILPPVTCASASTGFGATTQLFGFNFGSSNSRQECWESKEATECVNIAVAVAQTFGMREKIAIVAVGCMVQSPTFRVFAKTMGQEPRDFAKEILASYAEERETQARIAQAGRDRSLLRETEAARAALASDKQASEDRARESEARAQAAEDKLAAIEERAAKRKAWLAAHPKKPCATSCTPDTAKK